MDINVRWVGHVVQVVASFESAIIQSHISYGSISVVQDGDSTDTVGVNKAASNGPSPVSQYRFPVQSLHLKLPHVLVLSVVDGIAHGVHDEPAEEAIWVVGYKRERSEHEQAIRSGWLS